MAGVGFWELTDALAGKPRERRRTATATVARVDAEGVPWCAIAGGAGEFPALRSTATCAPGDVVTVEIEGGTATVTGNCTDPAASSAELSTTAVAARDALASSAGAAQAATAAGQLAEAAAKSAGDAAGSAREAETAAREAQADALAVAQELESAQADAAEAKRLAAAAGESADAASRSAADAAGRASAATSSANAALTQLSIVEDVVDVVRWTSEHGVFASSADGSPAEGKQYYTRSGQAPGWSYAPVTSPSAEGMFSYAPTPDQAALEGKAYYMRSGDGPYTYELADVSAGGSVDGLYERECLYYELVRLDDSVSNFLSSHLALTDEGLYITKDNVGCKLFLSADRLSFMAGDGVEVAYIAVDPATNESMFYMTRSVVVKDLRFGKWMWYGRPNTNMALKWVG